MIMIEVTVPFSQAKQVEPFLAQCCEEAGDMLLGRREYPEAEQVLLVVRLMSDSHFSKHVPVLGQALQQRAITSFIFAQGNLVKLSSPDILEQMLSFPLEFGDSWVPVINDTHSVYLCIQRSSLTSKQLKWTFEHQEVELCDV